MLNFKVEMEVYEIMGDIYYIYIVRKRWKVSGLIFG